MKENWALFTEVLTETNLLYGYLLPGIPIRYPLPRVSIGLTDSRKTAKNLVDSRKNGKILTVSRK